MELLPVIMELEYRVFQLERQCVFKLLRDRRIHPHQPALLKLLDTPEGRSQVELAKQLDVSPAAVAVSIRRMEKNGIVARETDPGDMRSNRVSLTAEGREVLEYANRGMQRVYDRKLKGFSREEREQLLQYLQRISDNLELYKSELEERI